MSNSRQEQQAIETVGPLGIPDSIVEILSHLSTRNAWLIMNVLSGSKEFMTVQEFFDRVRAMRRESIRTLLNFLVDSEVVEKKTEQKVRGIRFKMNIVWSQFFSVMTSAPVASSRASTLDTSYFELLGRIFNKNTTSFLRDCVQELYCGQTLTFTQATCRNSNIIPRTMKKDFGKTLFNWVKNQLAEIREILHIRCKNSEEIRVALKSDFRTWLDEMKQNLPRAAEANFDGKKEVELGSRDLSWLRASQDYEFLSDLDAGYSNELQSLGFDPAESTYAKPGSAEKVQILAARYAAGLPLWHQDDCYDHGPNSKPPILPVEVLNDGSTEDYFLDAEAASDEIPDVDAFTTAVDIEPLEFANT